MTTPTEPAAQTPVALRAAVASHSGVALRSADSAG